MFDKDLDDIIVEGIDNVYQDEFQLEQRDDVDRLSAVTDSISVQEKKEWLSGAFECECDLESKRIDSNEYSDSKSAVTELVSVQDKKKWLSGAFGMEKLSGTPMIET